MQLIVTSELSDIDLDNEEFYVQQQVIKVISKRLRGSIINLYLEKTIKKWSFTTTSSFSFQQQHQFELFYKSRFIPESS